MGNISTSKKRRVFDIIQIGQEDDILSRAFDIFITIVIVLNIIVLFLETFDTFNAYKHIFSIIEIVTTIIFIGEYVLRIWTAEFLYPNLKKWQATLRFLVSTDGIIILLSILPFFFLSGFVVFRMLRVARIFHLFRIDKRFDSFTVIHSVLVDKRNQIISSLFIILVLMFAASLCMYSAEHEAQPDVFKNAFSGIWWSVSALLTVGYGDIYPITPFGQFMAIVISFLGVGAVAIPTGIISAGFVEQYQKVKDSSEGIAASLQTVAIDIDSKWIGMTVAEIKEEDDIAIVLVSHDNDTFAPKPDYHIGMRDKLVVYRGE